MCKFAVCLFQYRQKFVQLQFWPVKMRCEPLAQLKIPKHRIKKVKETEFILIYFI